MLVRDFEPADEQAWLRCRVLAFLNTAYFDDVRRSHPVVEAPGFGVVAVLGGEMVGVLDVEIDGDLTTIDTVAVHPEHQGIGRALLAAARARLATTECAVLDAWTRDDPDTLRWYRAMGFAESDHYLHVYANHYTDAAEPGRAVTARPGLAPIAMFLHAKLEEEAVMRKQFARVHVCRRFSMTL